MEWGITQGPTLSGVGTRMKTVWPKESGGHDPDYKHRDFRDGEEIPEYEGTRPSSPTGGNSGLGCLGLGQCEHGLEFTSCCYFLLLHFSYLQISSHFTF